MKLRILVAEPEGFSEEARVIASQAGPVELRSISPSELAEAFDDYDVFWFRLRFRIEAALIRRSTRRVSVIVCPVTGLDHIDTAACRELGISVISLKGESEFLSTVRGTAELTIGLTLALLRRIPQACSDVREGRWNRDLFRGLEMHSRTVGIVGVGRLGRLVAGYFRAFGAEVWGFDVAEFSVEGVQRVPTLERLVAGSDIITVHVILDESTHHLFNAALFTLFKPGAVLINTSRGGVIDSDALVRALEEKALAGAALDVIENEHRPAESELITYARLHNNLLITPHIGGSTRESFEKTEVFIARKLVKHVLGVAA